MLWAILLVAMLVVEGMMLSLPALSHLSRTFLPLVLLLAGCIVLTFHRKTEARLAVFIGVVTVVVLLTFFINSRTGLLSGSFTFGDTLGVQVGGVPLAFCALWVILLYCTSCIAWRYTENPVLRPLSSALLMVVMDIFLEPIAARFDLWYWPESDVPISSYITWFVLSLILAVFFFRISLDARNRLARYVYVILLGFFFVLAFV